MLDISRQLFFKYVHTLLLHVNKRWIRTRTQKIDIIKNRSDVKEKKHSTSERALLE